MGEAIFGKYRLIAELGHGGMADVFLAVIAGPVGSGFSKLTVIKRLRQNLAEEAEFIEMLVDEARISARLNHPNVVQTNEVGSVGSHYFLAMEYLDGQPLHRIQHRAMQKAKLANDPAHAARRAEAEGGPASTALLAADPFPKAYQYLVIADTLAGLHHAHELADYDGTPLEIVHRDVTPHNVFVTYEGQVKVVDFGIAKAAGRASETRQGVVKGKVRFMAPEQAMGQPVDRRADIYSVGIMLWEAATGRRLWKDLDDLAVVKALVTGNVPTSPRTIDPNVPEAIDRICQKALASDRDERYATAEDFRVDLEQYLAESGQLVNARRKLGACVSELFTDKRAEIRAVIEKQLAAMKSAFTSDVGLVSIPVDTGSSGSLSFPGTSSGAVALSGLSAPVPRAPGSEPATAIQGTGSRPASMPPRRSRTVFAVGAAVLATGAIVLGFRSSSQRAEATPAVAAATVASAPAAPVEAARDVRVKITALPATAKLTLDGAPMTLPYESRLPRDTREHYVRAEAPGFEPQTQTLRFDSDVVVTVALNKVGATAANVTPAAGAGGAAHWTPSPQASRRTPADPTPPATSSAPPVAASAASTAKQPAPKPDIDKGDPWAAGH
ncbi:MAG: serine/threonine protein kinase [Labilithrix sp.]|nr:serine/threonine protein kinase [Labilithrix sp.]